ncbi:MAG: Stk1 family PASTA domain-containing Ser/Thr kinase [Clostridiales bacterium]|nr:Stk1 family PASTA domain-containing Ser/Thr kinase [Candidatus Cacconaster stercorequi]
MDQYIGKLLDNRYEILEQIGSGGMANVYKAKCHRLNRLVAVKILKSDLAEDAEFRRRFRDESQAVAQLSHANIVSVYDVSRSGETEYIVMELIDGITLKQYMERRGKMDWREALHFITQIMRGLSHAHSRGIIHRDIKPQNIMVLRDGSVKVADFGIACLANASQTLTQEALGSVHYISPEQARGDRTDARSDIYSAGVVLYEMLTGRLPFEGDSAVSVAIQHLSSIPLNPRDIDPALPEAMELITMKAMNPNADKRYASADEMLEDLEKFRRDPGVDMTYIRADLATPVDGEPTQPIATAEVNAAIAANSAKKSKKKAEPKEEEDWDEEEAKQNKKRTAVIIGGFAVAMLLVFVIFKLIFGGFNADGGKSHVVPNVIGKTYEEAMAMPEIKDIFKIEVGGSRVDEKFKPGQIIEQNPESGRSRKNNLVITVIICAEERKAPVPEVIGMDLENAKVTLKELDLNLDIQVQEEYSEEYKAGQVMDVSPGEGETVKEGATVTLICSKGPEEKPVTVPSFIGMGIDSAVNQAESLGLSVGESRYEYSDAEEGQVIGQSISTDSTVKEGTSITFTVSKGPEEIPVTVPNFLGMNVDAAAQKAESLGLRVGESDYEYSDAKEGKVIDQSISASSEVEEGTSICFTVSKGPEPVKTVSKDVSFTIPSDFEGNVEISFIQDGEEIGHDNGAGGEKVSCTVYGDQDTSSVVEAYFTCKLDEPDPETGDQFRTESAAKTVYFQ